MCADRLERSLGYLAWHHIAGAVLDVYRENLSRESAEGAEKANADSWGLFGPFRDDLYRRVIICWCRRTGLGPSYFAYSSDGVVRLYFRFRKRNAAEIEAFRHEIESRAAFTSAEPDMFAGLA